MPQRYRLKIQAEELGLAGEYTTYTVQLYDKRKKIVDDEAENITDLGSLVIQILKNNCSKNIKLETRGHFYKEGDKMIRDIVNLFKSR